MAVGRVGLERLHPHFHYRVLDYKQEKSLSEIPRTGLSADYVYREAKRARERNHLTSAQAGAPGNWNGWSLKS